jgi:hypothetical protein
LENISSNGNKSKMLSKGMTGEEIARELIETLPVTYQISCTRLVAVMRNRASVNGVALCKLGIDYPNLIDVGCFAHTINLVGDKFKVLTLYIISSPVGIYFFYIVLKPGSVGKKCAVLGCHQIAQHAGGANGK